jgi:hypothetical protein
MNNTCRFFYYSARTETARKIWRIQKSALWDSNHPKMATLSFIAWRFTQSKAPAQKVTKIHTVLATTKFQRRE